MWHEDHYLRWSRIIITSYGNVRAANRLYVYAQSLNKFFGMRMQQNDVCEHSFYEITA